MQKINKEQRKFIRQLHYRNEDYYDLGLIDYREYIDNNYLLLRQVRYSNINDEQKIILVESISLKIDLNKFRLGIQVARIGFN